MASINLESSNYAFRDSTLASRVMQTKNSSPKNRKVLTPTKTPSLFVYENHDCSKVDTENSIVKVTTRFFFSLFRFSLAHAWECKTRRGATHYNGGRSHCGCHAAHAALSPTLYDDQLEKTINLVKEIGYQNLQSANQEYLKKRFALNNEDTNALSSQNASDRAKHIMNIISRLQLQEMKGSFINTPIDFERNTTFQNPAASNRVDSYLEKILRPLEETLAEECRTLTKTPKEALRELFVKHKELIKNLKERLPISYFLLIDLEELCKNLIKAQEELIKELNSFDIIAIPGEKSILNKESNLKNANNNKKVQVALEIYICAIQEYRKAHHLYFAQARNGVPKLEELERRLQELQSPFVHKTLSSFYEEENTYETLAHFMFYQNHLHVRDQEVLNGLEEGYEEIKRRLVETKAQLRILDRDFEEIHKLMNLFFGQKNKEGKICTPTKDGIIKELNERLITVTPTRSDLHKHKRAHNNSPTFDNMPPRPLVLFPLSPSRPPTPFPSSSHNRSKKSK